MPAFNFTPKANRTGFDDIPEEPLDSEYQWEWALALANARLRPIAEALGQKNVEFTPQKDELTILSPYSTDLKCHKILKTQDPRALFVCTHQYTWDDSLNLNYVKPGSETYLSQEWNPEDFSKAASHELSHLEIFTVKQMLIKDHKYRRSQNKPSLSERSFNELKRALDQLNHGLDSMDFAFVNPFTQKIEIHRNLDVLSILKELVDFYFKSISEGRR